MPHLQNHEDFIKIASWFPPIHTRLHDGAEFHCLPGGKRQQENERLPIRNPQSIDSLKLFVLDIQIRFCM
jgi:hypothetical protein